MPPREPKPSTVKRLFALSRNQCAFPSCNTPIIEDSGVVTGIICHIKARNKGGPRYDPKQNMEQRHAFENLLLLCSRHSKIIDSRPKEYSVELLEEIKENHERSGYIELSQREAANAALLLDEYRAIYIAPGSTVSIGSTQTIHAETINLGRGAKMPKFSAPEGAIGSSLAHRNYAKHLIDRYHDFASKQTGRGPFGYPAIYAKIKKLFGAKWDMISLHRFDDFTEYMQQRIDDTLLGRVNRSRGNPNYSKFREYQEKYG